VLGKGGWVGVGGGGVEGRRGDEGYACAVLTDPMHGVQDEMKTFGGPRQAHSAVCSNDCQATHCTKLHAVGKTCVLLRWTLRVSRA